MRSRRGTESSWLIEVGFKGASLQRSGSSRWALSRIKTKKTSHGCTSGRRRVDVEMVDVDGCCRGFIGSQIFK